MELAEAPHLVAWELTRSCPLHCRHCRARALTHRDPGELSTEEIRGVLTSMAGFGAKPIVIFTGGDPLARDDLDEIIRMAVAEGFVVALAPSVTPALTRQVIDHWAALGVRSVSLSLDGATPAVHDGFRGVPGTYVATLNLAREVVKAGLRLQINTSVAPHTIGELTEVGAMMTTLGISSWEVFFVIPTGRAARYALPEADQAWALNWLAEFRATVNFRVTAVGAPQFIRYVNPRLRSAHPVVREARGMLFIDHVGQVYPSGYLPVSAGSVRDASVVDLYRRSPLFSGLRDPSRLTGRCGACDWRDVCGGSRARAYAVTGDAWAEDASCVLEAVPAPA